MKNPILLFPVLLLLRLSISAQSHAWQWAETCAQPNNSSAGSTFVGVTTDGQANVLVTGYFYNITMTLGSYTLVNHDQTGNTSDIFVAKYGANGNVLWAKSAGGESYDDAFVVNTDKEGNVYITGYFVSDSISFGDTVLYNHTTGDTFDDVFVAKYNAAGAFLWAADFGGDSYDVGNSVATDQSGNVYIAGDYQSGSISFGTTEFNNPGLESAFLVKCDSSGNVLWAVSSSSPQVIATYALCTDLSGNAFIAGRFDGPTADFGSQQVDNYHAGTDDIYLAKYDPSGNALWAQSAGGNFDDRALAIATDASGNAIITGYYVSSTAYFGNQQLTNYTSDVSGNVFTAKYDSSGNLQWVNGGYGNDNSVAQSVATDTSGNVYIAGFYYAATLTFGNDTLYNFDSTLSTDDVFVAEYNSAGNVVNAITAGGVAYDCGNGITTDVAENLYVVGFYRSDEIAFGDTTLYTSAPNHYLNPFLAKYSCVNPATPVITQSNDTLQSSDSSNNQWYLNAVAIAGATGQIYVTPQAGTYTVEVVNGPTCSATSEGVTTGIDNPLQLPAISLYPNPAGNFIVAESEAFSSPSVSAVVYDLTGKMVQAHYTLQSNRISFDVSDLAAGMYWLKVNINGNEATAKFVKVGSAP